jgi:cardiolipin synthase
MKLRFFRSLRRLGHASEHAGVPGLEYDQRPQTLRPGNRVELLHGGGKAFPAMLDGIRSARSHVHLETYILRSDRTGRSFQEALIERAKAGVRVRVLFDSLGSIGISVRYLRKLEQAGVEWVEFHPVAPWRPRWGLSRRDHQKILVVDDRLAFIGGLNVGDEYAPEPEGGGWHDMHARVEGEVVLDLARLFRRTWILGGGQAIQGPGRSVRGEPLERGPAPGPVLARAIDNYGLRNRGRMHRAYRFAMRRARESIVLMNAYFIPDLRLRRELRNAVRRGVSVRVLVPAASDVWLVQLASRYLYSRLLRAGVRIFEFPERMMHAKVAAIDGLWSTIGSFNLDRRSMFHNLEAGLVLIDGGFAKRLEEEFDEHAARCDEIDLETWLDRPWLEKALEWIAYRFRYWM